MQAIPFFCSSQVQHKSGHDGLKSAGGGFSMNIGPYCHFAQRDGVRAVFRRDNSLSCAVLRALPTASMFSTSDYAL